MRQIMFSRLSSIAATSARNDSSNIDCARRSYQRRCIVGSSIMVSASSAPNNRFSVPPVSSRCDDAVVAGDAACLVVAHAVGDEIDLVAEVVVQDARGRTPNSGRFRAGSCVRSPIRPGFAVRPRRVDHVARENLSTWRRDTLSALDRLAESDRFAESDCWPGELGAAFFPCLTRLLDCRGHDGTSCSLRFPQRHDHRVRISVTPGL